MTPKQINDKAKDVFAELDRMEDETSRGDCSDAIRVGYLQEAMKHLRWLFKEGIVYEGTGDLITAARNKAGLPHPKGAGADGVGAGSAASLKVAKELGRKSQGTRGRVKTKPADGAKAKEPKADVAPEAVQEKRGTNSPSS